MAKATGYEIGLVAIVVGLLVGGAVRKGSGARGGWFYQLMAVALTYAAISGSYFIFAARSSRTSSHRRPTKPLPPARRAARPPLRRERPHRPVRRRPPVKRHRSSAFLGCYYFSAC